MIGIKSENLVAIVDFLNYWEANISHDNLDSFSQHFRSSWTEMKDYEQLPDRTSVINSTPQKKSVPGQACASLNTVCTINSYFDDNHLIYGNITVLQKQEF